MEAKKGGVTEELKDTKSQSGKTPATDDKNPEAHPSATEKDEKKKGFSPYVKKPSDSLILRTSGGGFGGQQVLDANQILSTLRDILNGQNPNFQNGFGAGRS